MKKHLHLIMLALMVMSMAALSGCKKEDNPDSPADVQKVTGVYFCNDPEVLGLTFTHPDIFELQQLHPELVIYINSAEVSRIAVGAGYDGAVPVACQTGDTVKASLLFNPDSNADFTAAEKYDIAYFGVVYSQEESSPLTYEALQRNGMLTRLLGLAASQMANFCTTPHPICSKVI